MPITYKVLGQLEPTAATLQTLYTVPSATSAVCSTITFANLSGNTDRIRIAVRPAGESIADKHYITYDETLLGATSGAITVGITLATTDIISVYSSTGNTAFNLFGSEIS